MKNITLLLLLFFLQFTVKATALYHLYYTDTITDLSLLKTKAIYKAPNGKYYPVSVEADEETLMPKLKTIVNTNSRGIKIKRAVANTICDNNNGFDGSYRKTAKISIARHPAASTNLLKLIKRLTAVDNTAIQVSASSPRIIIEDSVVTLASVYLYAIARESDEDYHIIVGTSSNAATAKFFNIESSGLPPVTSASYNAIKTARQKVVAFLGGTERCVNGYIKFSIPPKVKIIGSLFYDKQHEAKIPGPATSKPKTVWELHPITEFKIL